MNKESYYYTNENEDDEYDSCRCGNVENGKY